MILMLSIFSFKVNYDLALERRVPNYFISSDTGDVDRSKKYDRIENS